MGPQGVEGAFSIFALLKQFRAFVSWGLVAYGHKSQVWIHKNAAYTHMEILFLVVCWLCSGSRSIFPLTVMFICSLMFMVYCAWRHGQQPFARRYTDRAE